MKKQGRKLAALSQQLLAIFIVIGIVGLVNGDVDLSIDSTNTNNNISSSELKIEARFEPSLDVSKDVEIDNSTQKIYPVYPETRSNVIGDKSAKKPLKNDGYSRISIKTSSRDSYLDALEHSHANTKRVEVKPKYTKIIRRVYDSPVYRPANEYGPPKEPSPIYGPASVGSELAIKHPRIAYSGTTSSDSFFSSQNDAYSLPIQQQSGNFNGQNPYGTSQMVGYGPPKTSYGIPNTNTNYGPPTVPTDVYGPPVNNYLPSAKPVMQQAYGPPPPPPSEWSAYALPTLPAIPMVDITWPFALKLNAFTIAKIILKLIIFKMIVKFIAVICLLMFIPKLEFKKGNKDDMENDDDDDGDGRRLLTPHSALERLNTLTATVLDAIEMYRSENDANRKVEKCNNNSCRVLRFLKAGETWKDYVLLFESYTAEENTLDEKHNTIDET